MNWAELKKNKGMQVKLVPPACHLTDFGEPLLPTPDEAWSIVSFQDETARSNDGSDQAVPDRSLGVVSARVQDGSDQRGTIPSHGSRYTT